MGEDSESISYLSADDIQAIHELIAEANAETTAGVASPGDIEYAVEHASSVRAPSRSTRRPSSCSGSLRPIIRLSMATSERRSCRPGFSTR